MIYSTPASLVMAGQGVSFVCFSFFFVGALVSADAPSRDNPETLDTAIGPFRPEASNSFFWLPAVPVPLFYYSGLVPTSQISCLYLIPLVHKIMYLIRHPFPFLFSILCLLGQADMLLMQPFNFSQHLLHLCSKGSGHVFKNWSTKDSRGRDWPGSRKGMWHQNRSSPKPGQEFLLPELVPPPFAGALVLETCIEFHCDS